MYIQYLYIRTGIVEKNTIGEEIACGGACPCRRIHSPALVRCFAVLDRGKREGYYMCIYPYI
jgi:hypothetical protein